MRATAARGLLAASIAHVTALLAGIVLALLSVAGLVISAGLVGGMLVFAVLSKIFMAVSEVKTVNQRSTIGMRLG